MRLIKPNPGECADRQTILELKIKFGGGIPEQVTTTGDTFVTRDQVEDGVPRAEVSREILKDRSPINIQPFIDENEAIQRYLEKNWLVDLPQEQGAIYDRLMEELAEVNLIVWRLTDQAHIMRDCGQIAVLGDDSKIKDAVQLLFDITDLNDKRAEIVRKMNSLFAINAQEKIFA